MDAGISRLTGMANEACKAIELVKDIYERLAGKMGPSASGEDWALFAEMVLLGGIASAKYGEVEKEAKRVALYEVAERALKLKKALDDRLAVWQDLLSTHNARIRPSIN